MEAALRALLLADSGVSALTQQISWVKRPEGTGLPAITLLKATIDRGYTFAGPDGYHGETVQFDIRGKGFGAVIAIRDAVLAAIEKPGQALGVSFSMSFVNSERQTVEDVPGVGAVSRISLDADVWWNKI